MKARRVAVSGAGISGLVAARELKAAGAEVVVLEARDRIGGRIWTSRAWRDVPLDLGASWIHGVAGNPLSALADKADARRVATDYDRYVMVGEHPFSETAGGIVEKARARAELRETDISVAGAIRGLPEWNTLSGEQRRAVRQYVISHLEHEYGGGWEALSAWYFDSDQAHGGGDELFPDGFDQITRYLARGLEVKLGTPVRSLAPSREGVMLETDKGSAVLDRAIVTVPLGVLKAGKMRFQEPLDKARAAAIEALGMGLLNKCCLLFDKVAWPRDVDWVGWQGPSEGRWAEWVSMARAVDAPILIGFHAAEAAAELEALGDGDMKAAAHAALKAMFGTGFPAPLAAQITRWREDGWSLGAYSFNAVGSTPQSRRALTGEDWEGRIVFAGEATSEMHFGTVHGALLSGMAAAARI